MAATYYGAKGMLSMGPSRPTLYQLILPVGGGVNEYLKFFCKAATIPEVRAQRFGVISHDAIGIERMQTSRIVFGKPFEITVIENTDFSVYKGIRQWFDTVSSNTNGRGNQSMRPAYYSDITRDFTLRKLENGPNGYSEKVSLEIEFKNAYPVRMGQIQLGSDLFDTATEYNIGFTYETYSYK